MASTAKIYVRKVKEKMETLKNDRQILHEVLDDYVDLVLSEAKLWVESQEMQARSYREICAILNECSDFVTEKCGEIAVALGKEEGEGEHSKATTQDGSKTAADSLAATSSPSLPLPSLVSAPGGLRSSPRGDYHFLKLKERIDNLENDRERLEKELTEIGGTKLEAVVSAKLEALERRPQSVAFTARVPLGTEPCSVVVNTIMKCFTDVILNTGDHFNSATGEFYVPVDGIYVAGLTHTTASRAVHLEMYVARVTGGGEVRLCATMNNMGYQIGSSEVCVTHLSKNDRLYVKGASWNGSSIRSPSSFFCFLLN